MRKITTTTIDKDYIWVGYVARQGIVNVMTKLVLNSDFYGCEVLNDLGGSGMWRLEFHVDHDKDDLVSILGEYSTLVEWPL